MIPNLLKIEFMQNIEHCARNHIHPDFNKSEELKNLPGFVKLLTFENLSKRQETLGNILDEIGYARMEFCQAEQFKSLLDGLFVFIQDVKSREAEQAIEIIELLSTQILSMIQTESLKLITIFKETGLNILMKDAFLNSSTPEKLKESLAYSISEFDLIQSVNEPCFRPVLDYLLEKLKQEQERLEINPYNTEKEMKRNKYGFYALDSILTSICFFSLGADEIKQVAVDLRLIDIGRMYLNHQSVRVRIAATCLFGLACDLSTNSEYRKHNDCLSIINETFPASTLQIVTHDYKKRISPINRIPHLHSGLLEGTQLCVNCDLHSSSDQTENAHNLEYRIIRNQISNIRDLIYVDHETAKTMCKLMKQRIERKEKEDDRCVLLIQDQTISTIKLSDPLSKVILYLFHPYSKIRLMAANVFAYMFDYGEKDWIMQEANEIRLRKNIIKSETANNDHQIQKVQQCNLCVLPFIFSIIHSEEYDEILRWLLWAIEFLLLRMENFVFEEKEERTQKKMENDDMGIDVECEQCGQLVSFGVFLQHMKGHNALQNIHYEIYQEFNDIYENENEDLTNNNSFITRKHLFEDIEEEGLIETIGSYIFRANAFQPNIACQIYKALQGLKY